MPKLWLAAILIVSPAPPAQDAAVQLNADFAWGRQFRPETLNPVVVTIDNPGAEIRGDLRLRWSWHPSPIASNDSGPEGLEGGVGPIYELPVVIPEKSRRRYFVSVEGHAASRGSLWVFLARDPRSPKPFGIGALPIAPEDTSVAQIGTGDAPGLSRAGARILLARPDEIPDRWHGYAPVDIALWLEGDGATGVDAGQVAALKRWIACGGHLIIARASAIGFAGTFLEELAGVRIKETRPHSDWTALAEWTEILESPEGEAAILEVSARGSAVLASSGGRPLVVRRRYARGRVTLLTFDPSSDTFRDWSGTVKFWKTVADLPGVAEDRSFDSQRRRRYAPTQSYSQQGGWGHERYVGPVLAGHLMKQPGVPIPPIGAGILLLVIYAVLIGPVDYLVLRRLRRLERTWITFPAVAVAFALVLVAVGMSMKRSTALVRDVVIEDHFEEADLVRSWSLTTVTLPDRDVIAAKVGHREATIRTFTPQESRPARIIEGRFEDWVFEYGSVGVAAAEWCETGPKLRVERDGPDRIRVVNGTGSALDEAGFAANGSVCMIGRIPEGESVHELRDWTSPENIDVRIWSQGRDQAEATWFYTGRRILNQMSLLPPRDGNRDRRGFAAAMDVRGWTGTGGGVLMGWCDAAPVVELSRGVGQRRSYRLVRAYTRND